jgi:hypothetical protein
MEKLVYPAESVPEMLEKKSFCNLKSPPSAILYASFVGTPALKPIPNRQRCESPAGSLVWALTLKERSATTATAEAINLNVLFMFISYLINLELEHETV